MKAPNKFFVWVKSPKSDFALFAIFLVLLNIAGARAFLRLDLTAQHSYSLSKVSRETIRSLEDPVSVKVFFSSNLPSPYNSVDRYLRDLLVEYSGVGSKKFDYQFFDMSKSENEELARSYGINMIQIQEVKDNEVGVKNAYMGLAVIYADGIEVLDNLTTADGLEYKLTTTISKMITTVSALSGLNGTVKVTLYASGELAGFGIQGFDRLSDIARNAYKNANKKSLGKLEFNSVAPSASEVPALAAKYGLQVINWSAGKDGKGAGSGVLGLVIEYGGRSRVIPLSLARTLFGGFAITGLDTLDQDIAANLQSLLSKSLKIGYVTGHGEKNLSDDKAGSARLNMLVSGMYEFTPVATATEEIPADISSLIIDGPRSQFTDAELYKIDQFLMKGGNIFMLVDPFEEIMPQGQLAMYGGQPTYRPVSTGLERLLSKYGVTAPQSYVLDKTCYIARAQGQGNVPLYYVPQLEKDSLNKKEIVSRNLAYVLFLQAGPLEISAEAAKSPGRRIVPLATSSAEAWRMSDSISLMPSAMQEPPKEKMKRENLAVLLEGKFDSAFESPPAAAASPAGSDASANAAAPAVSAASNAALQSNRHLAKSLQSGKIIVIGTSAVTTQALIDETGEQSIAIFVRNAIDYLNGNGDLIDMRTKGLGLDPLNKTSPAARTAARIVCLYSLPLLAAVAGLVAWRYRARRRRKIEARYKEA